MKITYKFDDDTTSEVEVSEEIETFIMDSRRSESNYDRKERYHCWSLDAIEYEGMEYSTPSFTDDMFSDEADRNARIREAFSHLTETQQRRMLLLASGLSEREIARREGVDIKTMHESIVAARKKFLKFF